MMWPLFILIVSTIADGARFAMTGPSLGKGEVDPLHDPAPTISGYLSVDQKGSELYFAYWEASDFEDSFHGKQHGTEVPIILWLQVT